MADYAKIFDPKPYTQGRSSQVEINPKLSEALASFLDELPVDQRDVTREQWAQYKTWDELPQELKDMLGSDPTADTDADEGTSDDGQQTSS